jgi:hypothetical protein
MGIQGGRKIRTLFVSAFKQHFKKSMKTLRSENKFGIKNPLELQVFLSVLVFNCYGVTICLKKLFSES